MEYKVNITRDMMEKRPIIIETVRDMYIRIIFKDVAHTKIVVKNFEMVPFDRESVERERRNVARWSYGRWSEFEEMEDDRDVAVFDSDDFESVIREAERRVNFQVALYGQSSRRPVMAGKARNYTTERK